MKRSFVDEERCYVFDVAPRKKSHGARFVGRIWVEDENYTIIRFNGEQRPDHHVSLPTLREYHWFHFDSWRTNVRPGLWLPAYIFNQEIEKDKDFIVPEFKAQTRLWGYALNPRFREEEFSRILLESKSPVNDESQRKDYSPVDKLLDTVAKNIVVTNNLADNLDLHCRVLLTTNLDLFSIENSIVISRGLLDVVPDEPTLAAILSQEIADAMIAKPYQSRYAFSDTVRLSAAEILQQISFRDNENEMAEIQAKSLQLLQNSPYKGKLAPAGIFLEELHAQAKALPQLISPRLGNRIQLAEQIRAAAPALEPVNKDQIAALPIGSRVRVDGWSSQIVFMKTANVPLVSASEKMPMAIAPLRPRITRFQQNAASGPRDGSASTQKE